MYFKLIKPGCVNVGAYRQENISTGDVIEFKGNWERKALANPDFKKVSPIFKPLDRPVYKPVEPVQVQPNWLFRLMRWIHGN